MPQYKYKAANERGRSIRGSLTANNEVDLFQRLRESGLELITCNESKERRRIPFLPGGGVPARDVIQMCMHLHEMQRAGVPLIEGLSDVRDSAENPALRDTMAEVWRDVNDGTQISAAFAKHPKTFGFVFVGLIQAGEVTGNLTESFVQLVKHLKWQDEMTRKIKKTTRYPLFTLVVAFSVIFFMMLFVVPQVVDFLKQSQAELPLITVALINTSNFFIEYWYLLVTVPVVLYFAMRLLARSSEDFAFWLDGFILRLPVIGPVIRKIALSRFSHFFAVMFQSGIEILKCLESSKSVVGNRALAESINIVQQSVRAGNRFSSALLNSGEFPNLVIRMVKVGEDTGALGQTLEQVTEFYDREVNESIDSMIGSIEPILTVSVGIILAWIVAAVFGPLYDNLGALTAG